MSMTPEEALAELRRELAIISGRLERGTYDSRRAAEANVEELYKSLAPDGDLAVALTRKVLAKGWLAGINRTLPEGPIKQAMFSLAEPKWAGQLPVIIIEGEA